MGNIQGMYFALGPAISAILGFVSIPLMTWVLPNTLIAQFGIFQYTSMGLLTIVLLGLDQAYLRNAFISDDYGTLLRKCLVPGLIFLLLIFTALLFIHYFFGFFSGYIYFLVLFFNVLFLIIHRFSIQHARVVGDGFYYFISEVLLKLPFLVFLIAFYFFNSGGAVSENVFLLFILFGTIFSSFYIVYKHRRLWFSIFSKQQAASDISNISLLKFGTPLAVSGVLYWAILNSTIYVSNAILDKAETSLLIIAISLSNIAVIGQTMFSMIWLPMIYKQASKSSSKLDLTLQLRNSSYIAVIFFVLLTVSLEVIAIFLGQGYSDAAKYAVVLSLLPFFYVLSEVTYIGVLLKGNTSVSLNVGLYSALTSLVFSAIFSKIFGLVGIAFAVSLAALVFFIARTYYGAKSGIEFRLKYTFFAIVSVFAVVVSNMFLPKELSVFSVFFAFPYLFLELYFLGFSFKTIFQKVKFTILRYSSGKK